MRAEVERTEARKSETPRAADIREGLVILECNEAFENTELSPWNAKAKSSRIDNLNNYYLVRFRGRMV